MMTTVTATELAQEAQEFLRFKRAMGMRYQRAEFVLDGFIRFVAQHWGEHGDAPLDQAVMRWTTRLHGRKAFTVSAEFGVVRQFCLYRRRSDPLGYVPEHALAPVKESTFSPYIFSHDEIHKLLAAATNHDGRFIWGMMLRTLMLVLYCTGMRLGEAVRLQTQDVNLDQGTLTVQCSKGRSRILPIRPDLVTALRDYVQKRHDLVTKHLDVDPSAFFLRKNASPLTIKSASNAFRHLMRELGIKPEHGRLGARPYEFRHAFAVHRLTDWASTGVDVHAKLPWLSAYLGHLNVLGTEVYLKATPQLLELASKRFEGRLRRSGRSP